MQSLIVIVLFVIISILGSIELNRNSSNNKYAELKADFVAGNIMHYHDLVYQYALTNYDTLHEASSINRGQVEQENLFDPKVLNEYSKKQTELFLDYKTMFFNYVSAKREVPISPTLYFITTWSGSAYHGNMLDVMGQVNQLFSEHIYQGQSSYWVIPWVGQQDNCNIRIFTQILNDAQGAIRVFNVEQLLNKICLHFMVNSEFHLNKYIYVQPVYKRVN